MNSKLFLLAAASSFSMVGVAANYTNFIIINLDDAGYGDFSYNGAYGYKTPVSYTHLTLPTNCT